MSTIERVRRSALGAEAWEPCITSDGRTIGEAEWLRRRTDEGSGDVASFPKGTRSVWTIVEPLEKFTVVSG